MFPPVIAIEYHVAINPHYKRNSLVAGTIYCFQGSLKPVRGQDIPSLLVTGIPFWERTPVPADRTIPFQQSADPAQQPGVSHECMCASRETRSRVPVPQEQDWEGGQTWVLWPAGHKDITKVGQASGAQSSQASGSAQDWQPK